MRRKKQTRERRKLGLLAIMKNEGMNLREWVDHYRWQGIDRVFLIDNGSTDAGIKLIEAEIAEGYVELFERPEPHKQFQHYQAVYAQAAIQDQVEWLVMADLDEFWFSPGSTLTAVVDDCSDLDLLYTNWTMFGSSGHKSHPASIRRAFIHRQRGLSAHADTKWICRTDAIQDPRQIRQHKVSGVDSAKVVSENDRLRLNHYAIQSLEYFTKVKMSRGDVCTPQYDSFRDLAYFERYDRPATMIDRTLADMLPNDDQFKASASSSS